MAHKTIKDAVISAIDYLEANPEQHIALDLALDKNGEAIHPCSEEAQCWCLIGRIARELEYDASECKVYEYLDRDLGTVIDIDNFPDESEPTRVFYRVNDSAFKKERDYTYACGSYKRVEKNEGAKKNALEIARSFLK